MINNPTKQQKIKAFAEGIDERLDVITLELDERIKELRILSNELINQKMKINTKIKCPKCGEQLDFEQLKEAIKERIIKSIDLAIKEI